VNFADPAGQSWQFGEGGFRIGWGEPSLIFSGDDVVKAAAATVDGIVPFGDPLRGVYQGPCGEIDPWFQFSRAMGAFARDTLVSAAIPNLGTWIRNPILYEIGQKTVSLEKGTWGLVENLSVFDRGEVYLWMSGGSKWEALVSTDAQMVDYAHTVWTGLTPGGNLLALGAFQGVDSGFDPVWAWGQYWYQKVR
jgi:hypothetical protein